MIFLKTKKKHFSIVLIYKIYSKLCVSQILDTPIILVIICFNSAFFFQII